MSYSTLAALSPRIRLPAASLPLPFLSFPIRMPGQVLQVECSLPNFCVTLKGGGDEKGLIDCNQTPNKWRSNTLHYALGRVTYDLVFDAPVQDMEEEITISIHYSTLVPSDFSNNIKPTLKKWGFQFTPCRWYKLVESCNPVRRIVVKNAPSEFRLAVAEVPLRVLEKESIDGEMELSHLPNGVLDFDNVFGAWLVFSARIPQDPLPPLRLELIGVTRSGVQEESFLNSH